MLSCYERCDHRVSRDDLAALPGTVLVNCTGDYSRTLFDDDRPLVAVRRHLIRAEAPLPSRDGALTSYVYKPADGHLLYCFPRTDGLSCQFDSPRVSVVVRSQSD